MGFHYSKRLSYLFPDYVSFSNNSSMSLDGSEYRQVSNLHLIYTHG